MLSIIICTLNRRELLERNLQSLLSQNFSDATDWEVIIVDNGSRDGTKELVNRFVRNNERVSYALEEKLGLSFARNKGISLANGSLICLLDDDVVVPPDYLENCRHAWKERKWDLAGGRVLPDLGVPYPDWTGKIPKQFLNGPFGIYDRGKGDFLLNEADDLYPVGANMMIGKHVFLEAGNFDTSLDRKGKRLSGGGDSEFCARARRFGMKIGYCGSCVLKHYVPKKRLTRIYVLRWKFSGSVWGSHELLPLETVLWFGIPRFCWRQLLEESLALFASVVKGGLFFRFLKLSSALGAIIGFATRKRKTAVEKTAL